MTPISRALRIFNACPESRDWALRFKTVEEAWEACPRGEWLIAGLTRADRCESPRLRAVLEKVCRLVDPPMELPPIDGKVRPDALVWRWTNELLRKIQALVPGQRPELASATLADEIRKVVPALLPAPVAPHRQKKTGKIGRANRKREEPLVGGE